MNYERVTFYVRDKDEIRRWIERFRLLHDDAYQADKAEIHQAIIETAQQHEDELLSKLAGENHSEN